MTKISTNGKNNTANIYPFKDERVHDELKVMSSSAEGKSKHFWDPDGWGP